PDAGPVADPDAGPVADPDASTPETTTETESPDTTPEKKGVFATFRGAYERFISKFKGEVQPEDEAGHTKELSEYAKKGAMAIIGGYASLIGYKGFHDFPAWLVQKYTTGSEKKRIEKERMTRETQIEAEGGSDVLEKKKAMLSEVINNSKFLTEEKKTELLDKVNQVVTHFEGEDKRLRNKRDEEIAKLLDQAIQTKIKTSTALKEGLNTALMFSGLLTLRAGVYGTASLMERYGKVKSEIETGERTGGMVNEFVLKGFTETASKLAGGVTAFPKATVYGTGAAFEYMRSKISPERSSKLDTHLAKLKIEAPKALRAVEGAATIMRLAGFGGMAMAEIMETGGPSAMIDAALSAFETKGAGQFALDNFTESPMKPIESMQKLAHQFGGENPTTGPTTPDGRSGSIPPSGTETTPDSGITQADSSDPITGAPVSSTGKEVGSFSVDIAGSQIEYSAEELKLGTVRKGDGLIEIFKRQGLSSKAALEAAREAGIVRDDGDTRLSTEAIGRLSVLTHTSPDGHVTLGFVDTQTGQALSLDEIRAGGFTYEAGISAPEIESSTELDTSSAETPSVPETPLLNSLAPNDLLKGEFHIFADADGNFTGIDTGGADTRERLERAIQELKDAGYGDSPEALYLQKQLLRIPEASDQLTSPANVVSTQTAPLENSVPPVEQINTESSSTYFSEHHGKFKGEVGKVFFHYDEDGNVTGAEMVIKRDGPRFIKETLDARWDLTPAQVRDYFVPRSTNPWRPDPQTSHTTYTNPSSSGFSKLTPEMKLQIFTHDVMKLERQTESVAEMEAAGLGGTPEYAQWKKETDALQQRMEKSMKIIQEANKK
ncbi:hypothetical protein HQ487_02660, partial [Candidatus Uhrbacteria bacterium]|nr:hypothetical protein [Candidatus Uhrbacteria bacterium]